MLQTWYHTGTTRRVRARARVRVCRYLGVPAVRFTQAGEDDGVRRALAGEYTVRLGVRQTGRGGGMGMQQGFAEVKLLAVE